MKKYTDKSGGLSVTKEPAKVKDCMKVEKDVHKEVTLMNEISLKSEDMMDTIHSYMSSPFEFTDCSEKGTCAVCGKQTAYKNRKMCVDCLQKYQSDVFDGLKNAVADIDIVIK